MNQDLIDANRAAKQHTDTVANITANTATRDGILDSSDGASENQDTARSRGSSGASNSQRDSQKEVEVTADGDSSSLLPTARDREHRMPRYELQGSPEDVSKKRSFHMGVASGLLMQSPDRDRNSDSSSGSSSDSQRSVGEDLREGGMEEGGPDAPPRMGFKGRASSASLLASGGSAAGAGGAVVGEAELISSRG